jgi:hypothetical protein
LAASAQFRTKLTAFLSWDAVSGSFLNGCSAF